MQNYISDINSTQHDPKIFFSYYFAPWKNKEVSIDKQRAMWANSVLNNHTKYRAQNLLPWDEDAINSIIQNTNFEAFNNKTDYAITNKNAQIRNLPSKKPFFKDPGQAGEGYPFDYAQNSRIHVNTPLLLSHYSKDGAWAFVQTPFSSGWLKKDDLTLLDAKERYDFLQAEKIIITEDNTAIYDEKQNYISKVKLGALFALKSEDENFYHAYMYKKEKPVHVRITKKQAKIFPLEFNKENILHVSKELLGENYGWGGYLGGRDCSSMIKDFFAVFGLWLPRNSFGQKQSGKYLSLEELEPKEKEKVILDNALAFESLLYQKGHVMLFVSNHKDKALIMHNIWGIPTQKDNKEGRAIVGKAVISDLHLGDKHPFVEQKSLLLNRVEGLIIKPNMPLFYKNPFVRAYPSTVKLQDNKLFFKDNISLPYHDYVDKTFKTLLEKPSIKDTLIESYPAFAKIEKPEKNSDPGRFRHELLLKKLYGNSKQKVEENLIKLTWLDGSSLAFNKQQNAAKQMQKVINELKKLPEKYDKYLHNIGGTYNYRQIAGTKRLSTHSFGIAIDLNVKNSSYWKWDKKYHYRNSIPKVIVDIFEKHGFIWGGRWYHYDTMHFEYRPEFFETID